MHQASEDDVIPHSTPIFTASGETTDRIPIAKETIIIVPIHSMNRSVAFWGEVPE
jgi:hypothetical protein